MKHETPMYFLKSTNLEDYNDHDDQNCVGVLQVRIYEDESGIYSLHDFMWESSTEVDPVVREMQMLSEVLHNLSESMLCAVDPEMNDLDDTENSTLQ